MESIFSSDLHNLTSKITTFILRSWVISMVLICLKLCRTTDIFCTCSEHHAQKFPSLSHTNQCLMPILLAQLEIICHKYDYSHPLALRTFFPSRLSSSHLRAIPIKMHELWADLSEGLVKSVEWLVRVCVCADEAHQQITVNTVQQDSCWLRCLDMLQIVDANTREPKSQVLLPHNCSPCSLPIPLSDQLSP